MARQLRIEYSGALYHVMARGDRKEPIVTNDGDRKAFIKTLHDMCERTEIILHAYTLLDNHYHLILETPKANLVEGMRWLQNTYTRRFNVCHDLWGHVFGGRYKALVIESDGDYFRNAVNYVHLNPVRAGLSTPEKGLTHYVWSSLIDYLQPTNKRPKWIQTERLLSCYQLKDTAAGRRAYLKELEKIICSKGHEHAGLVEDDPDASMQTTLRRGWYFGSEEFRDELINKIKLTKNRKKISKSNGYHGEQNKAYVESQALCIIEDLCRALGTSQESIRQKKCTDKDKVMIAEIVASKTTVSLDWLREQLNMRSRSYCSRLINDQRRVLEDNKQLKSRRERLLKKCNNK